MSHVATVKTKISNPQALVRALLRMGIAQDRIELHEKAIQCHGYHQEEKFMANVVVRKATYGSDIGWEKTTDGTYAAHIDDYHYTGQHYNTDWQTQVATYCNVEAVKILFEERNMEYTEKRTDRGLIQVRGVQKEDPRALLRQRGGR